MKYLVLTFSLNFLVNKKEKKKSLFVRLDTLRLENLLIQHFVLVVVLVRFGHKDQPSSRA